MRRRCSAGRGSRRRTAADEKQDTWRDRVPTGIRRVSMRLVDESAAEEDALHRTVEAGSADIDAGRSTTVAAPEDERLLREGMMARLKASLSSDAGSAYRLARTAAGWIDALLLDSARDHGLAAAGRHGRLILTVMAIPGDEPDVIGSVAISPASSLRAQRRRYGLSAGTHRSHGFRAPASRTFHMCAQRRATRYAIGRLRGADKARRSATEDHPARHPPQSADLFVRLSGHDNRSRYEPPS